MGALEEIEFQDELSAEVRAHQQFDWLGVAQMEEVIGSRDEQLKIKVGQKYSHASTLLRSSTQTSVSQPLKTEPHFAKTAL